MADQPQAQAPETGGGEGLAQPVPAEETKPVEAAQDTNNVQLQEKKEEKPSVQEAKVVPSGTPAPEEPKAVSQEVPPVASQTEPKEVPTPAPTETASNKKEDKVENGSTSQNGDWQKREQELLKKIEDLEKIKTERTEDGLKLELKVREEEIDLLKARVKNLETELQAALSKPSGKNHEMIENIKQQHEELLSKARGMIFDKTKMVKNQELQIEALTTQVQSLKDINLITKDLLEIRNGEVKAMEDRLEAMEARFKAEKERYALVLQRAQTSSTLNDDLKQEYMTQLAIFKELREKYEQRVKALVAENERLKGTATSGPST